MIINNNISSMRSQGALFANNRALGKDLQKLSTGLRINTANDDAAGLAISEGLRAQIRGQQQAKRNTLDGISALSIADGAYNEIHNILQRARELSVQAANATYASTERAYIQKEIQALASEINRIVSATRWNQNTQLLTGTGFNNQMLQVDANDAARGSTITISYANVSSFGITPSTVVQDSNGAAARSLIGTIDTAITNVSNARADIGSLINRLEYTVTNLTTSVANQQAAESQLRDLDFAHQSSVFTKNQILTQSATAMLTQANASTQGALSLIR